MNKKMSFAELKAKASAITTADALNAIKGGVESRCHDGKCFVYNPLPLEPVAPLKP